ncbi:MAG: sodium:proton antiporter [Bacteroidaceae bacterium]|nr:sodium:proton antiporter [Bacteroidaceae bacterium]
MEQIPAWMLIPFVVQLLLIAVLPLTRLAEWWESNVHKLYVSLLLGVPVGLWLCLNGMSHELLHQMLYDYVPFILLLMALFTTTGGICIKGDLKATPATNTVIMALGWVLASFMGTTGAAMLLIRLLLQTISQRRYKAHTVMFFIAIVANCGGLLSPLGDPPLFLLFQRGAHFTWFMGLWPEWLTTGLLLLGIYFATDVYYYRREPAESKAADHAEQERVTARGLANIVWLLCVVLSTMFINSTYIPQMGTENAPWYLRLLREWVFILIILLSILTTKSSVRKDNHFSWAPIMEVACVFLGIFAVMTPALMFLRQHPLPVTEPWEFVYATGSLSAFLDNAPTAMVFHATATSLPASQAAMAAGTAVAGVSEVFLRAICMGAVFFGALTYIGNGPNFMVKSIAEESGVKMPSFFGYMFKFSLVVCLPVYVVVQMLFF